MTHTKPARTIELRDTQILIDGEPHILLCASLFPFRIPPEQWRERLLAVKALGYHAVDVYIPWNFHETAPGRWNFSGRRDIDGFLRLAAEFDLLVLARPGPYICSEWDGGGIPAWLTTDPQVRLRQFEPRYLEAVSRWFDQVMPVVARHQTSVGGPIALVQLENELDFFDCDDPTRYVEWLRDAARGHGIDVPLIACAGQGDVERASGNVDGVVPAVNLYPSDESRDVEAHTAYYEAALRQRGLPLLVTETNRLHRTIKRMVGSGARLLGPYLQGSGWNFGYTTAVNNWGDLLGFMTHDYDFGGSIAPDGSERADGREGRRLAQLIDTLGPRLAASIPAGRPADVEGTTDVAPVCLALDGGGELLTLAAIERSASVTIRSGEERVDVRVAEGTALLLPRHLPLADWGISGHLLLSSAEIVRIDRTATETTIVVHTDDVAHVILRAAGSDAGPTTAGLRSTVSGDLLTVRGGEGRATFRIEDTTLTVVVERSDEDVLPEDDAARPVDRITLSPAATDRRVPWRSAGDQDGAARFAEELGVYAGSVRYRSTIPDGTSCGLVLTGASDILDVRIGDEPRPWTANGGTDLLIEFDGTDHGVLDLDVRAHVWGHSNFDDARLPSLALGSLRGISGGLVVTERSPLDEGWTLRPSEDSPMIGSTPPPRVGWGGWMTTIRPQSVTLERTVSLPVGSNEAGLIVTGSEAVHDVFVGERHVGTITPQQNVLWVGPVSDVDIISVTTLRSWGEPAGTVELLAGTRLEQWSVTAAAETEMVAGSQEHRESARPSTLPLTVRPGEAAWMYLDLRDETAPDDSIIRIDGRGLMLTFVSGREVLGRLWTETPGARLKGGRGDVILVPGPWRDRNPIVSVLVEATGTHDGTLSAVMVGGPIDLPDAPR